MYTEPRDRFVLIDFDRTLANVDTLHDVLESVVTEETGVATDFLRAARLRAETEGRSFDTIEYVKQYLAEANKMAAWDSVVSAFTRQVEHRSDALEPHARDFLDTLLRHQLPFGIITYGIHEWQLTKIHAVGLGDIPHYITPQQEKGKLITSWRAENGEFTLPEELSGTNEVHRYRHLTFIDDKPVSFLGVPEEVTSILVRPVASRRVDQADVELASSVRCVFGLQEAEALLFGK